MGGVLLLESSWGERARATFGATAVLVVAGSLLAVGAAGQHTLGQRGAQVSLSAAGTVEVETGPFYSDVFEQGTGELRLEAEDFGARVTPLPPRDELRLTATVSSGGREVSVEVDQAMVNHPLGEHTTWWGVGLDVEHHGHSGIGTDRLPAITSAVAAFGLGEVSLDGQVIATGVPVHFMTADDGLPAGARLEMDVGMADQDVPGLPAGHLRVLWADYQAQIDDPHPLRYAIGISVLLVLLVSMVWLLQREPVR